MIALAQTWNVAEQTSLEEYNQRVGRTQQAKVTAANIVDVPPILLPGFWDGAPPEDYSFEATLLRTVEWCEITGFDQWWRRLARCRQEILLKGARGGTPSRW